MKQSLKLNNKKTTLPTTGELFEPTVHEKRDKSK